MWKYVLAWVPMVVIAIANGALREAWYATHVGELRAHQISTLCGIALFAAYIWVVIRIWRPASSAQALAVGLLWLAMTIAFEFLFGHFAVGHPWSRLIQDYNLLAGRVWLAVPLFVAAAPYFFHRWQG